MNNEIVIGNHYTSIIGSNDDIDQVERNYHYNEDTDVNFKPIYRKRTIKTLDFFNGLKTNLTNHNEILPAGCKYFQTFVEDGKKLIVIEEPPRFRTIKVDVGMEAVIEKLKITGKLKEYGYENYLNENERPYSFQLAFPYVIFIILLNRDNGLVQMRPFFRLHPLTSLFDYLFMAPLYNIPEYQSICLGSLKNFNNIFETVENIIETFWLNEYNTDYTHNISAYEDSEAYEVQDYFTWMYFSKVNPMFIYNVKWIKYRKNLNQIVNCFQNDLESSNYNGSYDMLHRIVSGATSSELPSAPGTTNITYSLALKGRTVEIGDEIIFNNQKMYLYSITAKGDAYGDFELENEKGELISVPYDEFEVEFEKSIIKNKLKEAVVNGKVIKPDDIITYKLDDYNIYKKIKSIRVAQDGKIEALIGRDHYLIENIEFEIMDLNEIKINGEILDKDKEYWLIVSNDKFNITYRTKKMKFSSFKILNSGHIIIKFISYDGIGNDIDLNYNNYIKGILDYDFMDSSKFIEPAVLSHFDKLLLNSDNNKFKVVKNKGIFIGPSSNNTLLSYMNLIEGKKEILEKILIANGTRLYIPRVSCDIDFKIGDPIVYANWDQPNDMLIISSIDNFEYNEDNKILFIHSTSLNKKVQFKIPYINFKTNVVNIGMIRKVESQCGEWKSGDKIKANSTGITNFPKKDVNSIIAFINDGATKYPIALCSNLCTLWMNEDTISKFDRMPFKTPAWNKYDISPICISKIKWQHGDNFVSQNSDSIKFVAGNYNSNYLFEYHYCTTWGSIEWGTRITKNELDAHKRHGVLMPRVTISNLKMVVNSNGFPNMLGGYLIDSNSKVYFRSEQFKEDF